MFHPEVIAARLAHTTADLADLLPGGRLPTYSHDECWARQRALADAVTAKREPLREITSEESAFILHERLRCKLDYRYFSERYAVVTKETQDASPLVPRWASQDLFLARLAELEYRRHQDGHPDGLLVNILKARQLGVSTETEVILAHRLLTQTSVRGLVAGDVPEQSKYLFGMAELVIDSAPWWLRPDLTFHQTGSYLQFATGASLRAAAGKSQRGGLQDRGGAKGNIGRGKTYGLAHLSEISTWERPEQIEDGLMPGVPRRPRTFMVRESTAKGRNDYWHQEWKKAAKHLGRFTNIFIPWYIEPDKYWLPPPVNWIPATTTVQHADTVARTSPGFLLGTRHTLSRPQMYWYEQTRRTFEEDGELHKFLEEYPATPEEAFQHAGRSVFSSITLERVKTQERTPVAILRVEPARDIAILKAWEREAARQLAAHEAPDHG